MALSPLRPPRNPILVNATRVSAVEHVSTRKTVGIYLAAIELIRQNAGMGISRGIASRFNRANRDLYPEHLFYGPEWIVLGVNNICNLHCAMCDVGLGYESSNFYQHLMGARPINMPLPLIERIIEQTASYFPSAKLGYAFTEPGIYPHLVASLRRADELALHTAVTTNGLRLPNLARDLADAGLNELFVSLDGPPEIHNQIRGHRKSFQRAFDGIVKTMSLSGRRPEVSVFCTVTPWNIGHLEEFVELFSDIPLSRIGFMHTNFTTAEVAEQHNRDYGDRYPATPSNVEELDFDRMDLDVLWENIAAIKKGKYNFPVSFSPEITDREGLRKFYREPGTLIGRSCSDAFRCIMFKSDGTVIPAHGRCYRVTGGSIYNNNLKELWNSAAIGEFRRTLTRAKGLLPACARCCSAF